MFQKTDLNGSDFYIDICDTPNFTIFLEFECRIHNSKLKDTIFFLNLNAWFIKNS